MKMFSATLRSGNRPGMLVHDRDAVALRIERCRELDRLAVQHDLTGVRADRPRPAA